MPDPLAPQADPDLGLPIAFRFRTRPEEFLVEELPAYPPSGSGQHAWVWIEKRGLTTEQATRILCQAAEVSPRGAGHAGLKDKRAVARQALTLDGADPERLRGFEAPGLKVLEASRHGNKLRPGHLKGNRFRLGLRGLAPEAEPLLRARLEAAERRGFANRFGAQRLGVGLRHGKIGLALLAGETKEALDWLISRPGEDEFGALKEARELAAAGDLEAAAARFPREYRPEARAAFALAKAPDQPARALNLLPPAQRRLFLNAGQSLLFNAWLERRAEDLGRLLLGDVCQRSGARGPFLVEDLETEQARADNLEISAAGPLFGANLFAARGPALALEDQVLFEHGLEREAFSAAKLEGQRRVMRLCPSGVSLAWLPEDELGTRLEIGFELPPGAYATALLDALSLGGASEAGPTPVPPVPF